jgi:serine/threonine protein kinase
MAPEIISAFQDLNGPRRGNFGFAADIWTMGIIIAELGMQGKYLVMYEDEEERERWEGDFVRFSRTMASSREMLMRRVERHLHGDHAMLVERVRVLLKSALSDSGTNRSFTKMIEIDEASRPNFDEITAHPFFSRLDHVKVLQGGYRGTSTLSILARESLPTRYVNSSNSSVRKRPTLLAQARGYRLVLKDRRTR